SMASLQGCLRRIRTWAARFLPGPLGPPSAREPRCALGIVDWNPATGRSHHVGVRGRAEVLPFDTAMAKTIFRRYFGPDERDWDRRFDDVFTRELNLEMVRITPETVVVRDQSYKPTPRAQQSFEDAALPGRRNCE